MIIAVNIYVKQFLTEHGERRSIEEIPAVELNNYLSKFVFASRTKKAKSTNHLHLEEFCRVLSATYVAPVMGNLQQHNRVYKVISLRHIHRLQPLKTQSKQCFKVIIYITGGVFNINLAPTKNTVTSPELGPKAKKSAKFRAFQNRLRKKNRNFFMIIGIIPKGYYCSFLCFL